MDYRDIISYLEGKATVGQSAEIRNWLKNPKNDKELREVLGNIWANSEIKLAGSKPNFDRLLDQLHHDINLNERASRKAWYNPTIKKIYIGFSRVAAVLLIPVIIFSAYLYYNSESGYKYSSAIEKEIYTKPGTRTKIELNDGTLVWLNDGTLFKYPEVFTGNERHVFVDGEAYFEVKANARLPFIVHNPLMNTVVTGTKFNLNAYSSDKYFEATLLEGKVELEKKGQKININPNQQIQYNSKEEIMTRKKVNPRISTSWIEGKLILQDESLSVAAKKLSRWYNVEIVLEDPELNDYLLTATLKNEKLYQTLDLISLAIPVQYRIEKEINPNQTRKVYFMKK